MSLPPHTALLDDWAEASGAHFLFNKTRGSVDRADLLQLLAQRDKQWADAVLAEREHCARGELVVALHTLASHFENALYAFRGDAEALTKAKGDIAWALKIAARHNQNGQGCAAAIRAIPPEVTT